MKNENYEKFFEEIKEFLAKENERKKRDNDYNPLLALNYAYDEVNLHSRVLFSLLNPLSNHEQGTLFLELFLDKALKNTNFTPQIQACKVYREYSTQKFGRIDLYITDEQKHIIIENKIGAGDGEKQIQRYIEFCVQEKKANYTDICVLYLSPTAQKPEKHSRVEWEMEKNSLKNDKGERVAYKNITYESEILAWLDECQKRVKNVCNLNAGLEFYKDTILYIINKKGNTMKELEEKLLKNPQYLQIALQIKNKLQFARLYKEILEQKLAQGEGNFAKLKGKWHSGAVPERVKNSRTTTEFAFVNKDYETQAVKFTFAWMDSSLRVYVGFRLFVRKNDKLVDIDSNTLDKVRGFLSDELQKENVRLDWAWFSNYVDLDSENIEDYFLSYCDKADRLNEALRNFNFNSSL